MVMARHQFTVQDAEGDIVPSAHVEVRSDTPGQPLAAVYSDRAGTVAVGNPSDADSEGFWYGHMVGGPYQIRVYLGPSGSPTFERIWRYVAVGLNAEGDIGTVSEVNGADGAVTIDAGTGIDVTTVGDTITITNTATSPAALDTILPLFILQNYR